MDLQALSLETPPAPRLQRLLKADLAHAADCDSESTCIGCAHWPCCGSDDRYDLICVADDDRIAQTPKEACWQLLRAAQALFDSVTPPAQVYPTGSAGSSHAEHTVAPVTAAAL